MVTSREIRLNSRPVGMPTSENFELATVPVSDPQPGEVQVKNLCSLFFMTMTTS